MIGVVQPGGLRSARAPPDGRRSGAVEIAQIDKTIDPAEAPAPLDLGADRGLESRLAPRTAPRRDPIDIVVFRIVDARAIRSRSGRPHRSLSLMKSWIILIGLAVGLTAVGSVAVPFLLTDHSSKGPAYPAPDPAPGPKPSRRGRGEPGPRFRDPPPAVQRDPRLGRQERGQGHPGDPGNRPPASAPTPTSSTRRTRTTRA